MVSNLEKSYSYFSDYLFMNLLNTVRADYKPNTDLLDENGAMESWISLMLEKHLLKHVQADRLREEPIDVKEIRNFRDQWRAYFMEEASSQEMVSTLSKYTTQTPLSFHIESDSLLAVPSKGGTEGLLSLIAFTMLEAFEKGIFSKVQKCGRESCLALFINQKGTRKWCSMSVCGNRSKAEKHYQKAKQKR